MNVVSYIVIMKYYVIINFYYTSIILSYNYNYTGSHGYYYNKYYNYYFLEQVLYKRQLLYFARVVIVIKLPNDGLKRFQLVKE